jgi:hypothetical protein
MGKRFREKPIALHNLACGINVQGGAISSSEGNQGDPFAMQCQFAFRKVEGPMGEYRLGFQNGEGLVPVESLI